MVSGATVVGLAFLVTGCGLLVLLREPIRQPEKPASIWFGLTVVGIALWPLCLGASYLVADAGLSVLAWNGRAVAAALISVSWLLLAVEYTTRRRPARLLLIGLAVYLLVDVTITWSNPLHHLVLTERTTLAGTVVVPDYGPWFWARTIVNYGLILLATAILVVEWSSSSGLRRRQSAILAVAVVPPIIANVLTLLSAVPSIYDLTPFGLAGSGLLLTWALYRVEFLDVVPVARKTAMEEMRDAVVTLDDEGRIVDCNAAARDLFAVDEEYVGTTVDEFFDAVPDEVLGRFRDADSVETEVSIETRDGQRHFSLSISPVQLGTDVAGRVVVLRDVTPLLAREQALEERQQELDLLRQVLTRVLRHNLRNALTTIHGNAEVLMRELEDEDQRRASRIVNVSDDLLRISEKAGHVERIAVEGDPITYDLVRVVTDVVENCQAAYPSVSFETELPETCSVEAGRGLQVAIEALVENAAAYGDPDAPSVTVTVEKAGPSVRIVDNGPGIPDAEVAVLEAHEETPLEHGSGIGLWIAKWVADHAGADLLFDVDESGTTVTMDFGADRSPLSHVQGGSDDDYRSSPDS